MADKFQVVLSFDVEEHWRIEAAAHLTFDDATKSYYAQRVAAPTQWILDQLAEHQQRATFFIVGELAQEQTDLVKAIHAGGHEVASHGWDHRRILAMNREEFAEDVRKSKDALEQIIQEPVVGYRAPTFSLVRKTAWALDVLADQGMKYDSSIYPVSHDRYGIADAPRGPFLAQGDNSELLELPPVRYDCLGLRIPMGGGGYFRLFPLWVLKRALRQVEQLQKPPLAMLYFHPWEFDPEQNQLPLSRLSRFRTYVGTSTSRSRLTRLMSTCQSIPACEMAEQLQNGRGALPEFSLSSESAGNIKTSA